MDAPWYNVEIHCKKLTPKPKGSKVRHKRHGQRNQRNGFLLIKTYKNTGLIGSVYMV